MKQILNSSVEFEQSVVPTFDQSMDGKSCIVRMKSVVPLNVATALGTQL